MDIQHINIMKRENGLHIVDMLIADDPQPDEDSQIIEIVVHQSYSRSRPLAELQLKVLEHARSVIDHEIQVLKRLEGPSR